MSFRISKSWLVSLAVVGAVFTTGCSGAEGADASNDGVVPSVEAPTLTPRTAMYPGNQQPANPAMGLKVTIPAGKVAKFTYAYKGVKEQFAMIHNLRFDLPLATSGNYHIGPRTGELTVPAQTADIDYLITGYSKDCHWSSRCDRRAWVQEPGKEILPNTIGFEDSAEETGDFADITVTWSIQNP